MIEKLDFVGVPTQDVERAKKFYGETLGLRKDDKTESEFWVGETCLGIWEPEQQGMPFAPSEERPPRPARRGRREGARRARGEGRRVRRRHLRHRRLPHGPVHRPRRQRPDAAPPLRAAGLTPALMDASASTLPAPAASAGRSFLGMNDVDRRRMLEMEERIRPVRAITMAALGVAVLVSGAWIGYWTIIPVVAIAASVRRRRLDLEAGPLPRVRDHERLGALAGRDRRGGRPHRRRRQPDPRAWRRCRSSA